MRPQAICIYSAQLNSSWVRWNTMPSGMETLQRVGLEFIVNVIMDSEGKVSNVLRGIY